MILELVTFRLMDDVSEKRFSAAVRSVDEFLAEQAGFLARQVMTAEDGGRVDLVWWKDLESAQEAARAIREAPRAEPFLACLDPGSIRVSHSELAHSVPRELPW